MGCSPGFWGNPWPSWEEQHPPLGDFAGGSFGLGPHQWCVGFLMKVCGDHPEPGLKLVCAPVLRAPHGLKEVRRKHSRGSKKGSMVRASTRQRSTQPFLSSLSCTPFWTPQLALGVKAPDKFLCSHLLPYSVSSHVPFKPSTVALSPWTELTHSFLENISDMASILPALSWAPFLLPKRKRQKTDFGYRGAKPRTQISDQR